MRHQREVSLNGHLGVRRGLVDQRQFGFASRHENNAADLLPVVQSKPRSILVRAKDRAIGDVKQRSPRMEVGLCVARRMLEKRDVSHRERAP